MEVVGYTYDAALHCVSCTLEYARNVPYAEYDFQFGQYSDEDIQDLQVGIFNMTKAIELEVIKDSENNPLHAIFSIDEAGDTPDHCDDCGAYINTSWHSETVGYAVDRLWDYVNSFVVEHTADGNPEVLDIWADELDNCIKDTKDEFVLFMYRAVRKEWDN